MPGGGGEAGVGDAAHDEPLEVGDEKPRDALDTGGGGILGEAVVVVGDETQDSFLEEEEENQR